MYVLGGICAGAGALGAWYFGGGHDPKTQGSAAIVLAVLSGLFFAFGVYLIYSIARFRIVLTSDAIGVQQLGAGRTYPRAEFSAWRISHPSKGPNMLVLAFRDPLRKPLKIPQYFTFDALFREWLDGFANLDEQERAATEREIADSSALGSTTEERLSKLIAARRTSKRLIAATIVASVWVLFVPVQYRLAVAMLASIPWLALWVAGTSHGLFRIDQKRNDPHPSVAIPFMMPGFILMLRGITAVHMMVWQRPLALTVVITAALSFAAHKADRSLRTARATATLLFTLAIAYGFGVTTLSNELLDSGKVRVYPTHVLEKHISHGRSTTYRLYLDAWGPQQRPEWVDVSRSFYSSVDQDNTVCVYLSPGALRIPWYVVGHCSH